MLLRLTIENIALIDRLEISFAPGLNVLTGETGAGKSIIVGSLDLLLGGKADRDRIAQDAERGRVEGIFDVSGCAPVLRTLDGMELTAEDGLLSVSREVYRSGKTLNRIAGVTVPLAQFRAVTSLLADLHGQHAHQSLLDPKKHLAFLDATGDAGYRGSVSSVRDLYSRWHSLKVRLSSAENSAMERARREDMLRFQLDELDAADLRDGEERTLEERRETMRSAEKIRSALENVSGLISGGVSDEALPALDALKQAAHLLSGLARYGASYEQARDQLWEAIYALENVSGDIESLLDGTEDDPQALEAIESRLDLLFRLKRKYGATTHEMIAFREKARAELEEITGAGLETETLAREEKKALAELNEAAAALSRERHRLAQACRERVLKELSDLGMSKANFEVHFLPDPPMSESGADQVEFLLSANTGEPLRPLSKVASGGELSRIMLAFKCIEADVDAIPVLVFDEVDTGISGRIAQVTADKMAAVAENRQVLCVTHLPQIAAAAQTQYLVEKSEQNGRTRTTLRRLDEEGRVRALSDMLGGGETAREHARAMLKAKARADT